MPRLLLLRHAKAERARPGERDHDRVLTKRGHADSEDAGRLIAGRGETIDLVLASDSRRTRETWDGVAPHLDAKPEVRLLHSLYEAHDTYLPILRDEGGDARTILVVGHNPTIHATAVRLAADLSSREGRGLADGFPKAGLAVLDFDGTWQALQPRQMRLVAFITPDRG